jgi:hypothetical protein
MALNPILFPSSPDGDTFPHFVYDAHDTQTIKESSHHGVATRRCGLFVRRGSYICADSTQRMGIQRAHSTGYHFLPFRRATHKITMMTHHISILLTDR